MTLLDTIKSLLGLGDGRQSSDRGDRFDEESTTRSAEPATDTEAAVKGADEGGEGTDDPAAAGGDAAGSTESMVDEQAEGGAESGEVTSPGSGGDVDSGETESGTDEHDTDETDGAAADTEGVGVDETADESAAAGGDAAGSTGSITDETNESISATEDAEAAGPTGAEPTDDTDQPVDMLKGIGPSYADQLSEAGVKTVADLAESDPTNLADETDIPASRIERWNERAKARRQ